MFFKTFSYDMYLFFRILYFKILNDASHGCRLSSQGGVKNLKF